jgi:hypothetical protein
MARVHAPRTVSNPENPAPEEPSTALAIAPPAKLSKKRGPRAKMVLDAVPTRRTLEGFVPSDELKQLGRETDEACREAWRQIRANRLFLPNVVDQALTEYDRKLSALVDRELDEEAAHRGE